MSTATQAKTRPRGIPRELEDAAFTYAWDYRDTTGKTCGWVARFDGPDAKVIRPFFHLDGEGRWRQGRNGKPWPLFGLDTLQHNADTVYICEGEKATAALHALGLPAVTSGGTGTAGAADWSPLRHARRIILLPDNDDPGEAYARDVAAALSALPGARDVLIARIPDLPAKGDIVDHLRTRIPTWSGYGPLPLDGDDLMGEREVLVELIGEREEALPAHIMASAEDWPEPEPLRPMDAEPEAAFPVAALGPVLAGAVDALREGIQAPTPLIANAVLAATGAAVQHIANVDRDGARIPCSIFALTIADSGERKTSVDAEACKALRERQRELDAEHRKARADYEARKDAWESERKRILPKTKDYAAKQRALADLGPQPEEPARPVVFVADATREGLERVYRGGWPSCAVITSEGAIITGGHGMRENRALATIGGFSLLWDGLLPANARAGAGVHTGGAVRCSMHLMLQQIAAERWLGDPEVAGQGILSRYLITWPVSTQGERPYRALDLDADPRMVRYHNALLDALHVPHPLDEHGHLAPRALRLNADARQAWIKYFNTVEAGQLDTPRALRPWTAKAGEHALRLAGVLTLAEHPNATAITLDTMRDAIRIATWYGEEGRRIVEGRAPDPVTLDAEKLLQWMRTEPQPVAKGRMMQFGPGPLRGKAALDPVLDRLVDSGWIRHAAGRGEAYEARPG